MTEIWEAAIDINRKKILNSIVYVLLFIISVSAMFVSYTYNKKIQDKLDSCYIPVQLINVQVVKNNNIEYELMQKLPNNLVLSMDKDAYNQVKLIPITPNLPIEKLIYTPEHFSEIKHLNNKNISNGLILLALILPAFGFAFLATTTVEANYKYLINKKFIKNNTGYVNDSFDIINHLLWFTYRSESNKVYIRKVLDQTNRPLYLIITITDTNEYTKTVVTEEQFDNMLKNESSEENIKLLKKVKESTPENILDIPQQSESN